MWLLCCGTSCSSKPQCFRCRPRASVGSACWWSACGRLRSAERTSGSWLNRTCDFDRLRAEFGARSDFTEICERDRPLHQLAELVIQKDWNTILVTSEPWLQRCPIDIDAHLIRAVALKELKRLPEAEHHLNWFRGLVDSVLTSGDGKTPQTAFVVISVAEEYSILRVLRVRPKRHVTLSSGIDELVVEIDGVAGTLYFNPTTHARRLGERPTGLR